MDNERINEENWLEVESKELKSISFDGEKLPSLIFEENKIVEFKVDFLKKFDQWIDKEDNKVKKIIPVEHLGVKKVLWLNTKNPLYAEIIKKGLQGVNVFKVIQTGNKSNTKYNLVE